MKTIELLKLEEELLSEELSLQQKTRVEEYLVKLDNLIHNHSKNNFETVKTCIECSESLSKDFKLPLKVKGVFLFEGKPQNRYYSAKELEKAANKSSNQSFRLMQDHKHTETSSIVGMVTKIEYDSGLKGLRWYGHVNDETTARNIVDGSITEVSVTVYSTLVYDNNYGNIGTDLEFSELSTVIKGAAVGNYIEVDN